MNQKLLSLQKQIYSQNLLYFIERCFCIVNQGDKYIHNWHIDAIAEGLSEVYRGNIKRLLINMPPRYLKSFCVSVCFPAWVLGKNPVKRIIVASYSEKLSLKHSCDCRLIMENQFFKQIFSNCVLSKSQNEKYKFATSKNGFRFATSVAGTLTGEGGDFLIVDDPHNPQQVLSRKYREKTIDWFMNTFLTRLNDKNTGAMVVVMQRLHSQDLSSILINSKNWEHINLQAISEKEQVISIGNFSRKILKNEILFEKRENRQQLEQIKIDMGLYNFNAQYQQNPIPAVGTGMIKKEWFLKYNKTPVFENIYLSFDTAIKVGVNNDPTVCTVWGVFNGKYYLIEVIREWLEYPELKRKSLFLIEKYKPTAVLIEDKSSGQSLIQDLKRETKENIIAIKVNGDKITRFATATTVFEAGRVLIFDNSSWLFDYEFELLSFPDCEHDDQIDSTGQFLNWIENRKKIRKVAVRRI